MRTELLSPTVETTGERIFIGLMTGIATGGILWWMRSRLDTHFSNGEFINQDGSSLNGERLDVKGDVFLCEGDWSENATVSSKHLKFKSKGEVNLVSAKIGGTLECTGGLFRNPGGYALQAGGLKVGRNVYLQNGFRAEGEIGLVDATIEGNLECNNGEFINNRTVEDKEPIALNAERLTVKGDVFLCKGRWGDKRAAEIEEFRAEGEVKLVGARIGGTLQCRGGKFLNPGYLALRGRGLKVEGNVFLDKGFSAEGEVSLVGAQIGGNLDCEKGSFIHEQGKALFANGLKVEGNVLLWSGFKAKGQVSLVGARIDGFFYWMDVQSPEDVRLDLRSAKIGTLRDQEKSWPKKGELFLHGLDYDGIHNIAPREADSRIEWLGRQYNKKAEKHKDQFSPQPYEHLVRVLRKGGQDADAKKILIAKNRDKARLTKLTWSEWLWYRLFGPLISYGYRPLNALWGIVVLIAFGWILFGVGYWCGLITPQSESAYVERDTKIVIPGDDDRRLSDVYPRFNFLVYSVDVFVPLIDLHQTKYWLPNANRGPELFNIDGFVLHTGGVLRLYMWIHIVLGWILTTLLVVGVTGLVRT